MELHHLRIINCFGFADTSPNLEPRLVYILGRNSSGKTSLLDAINQLAPRRVPEQHRRFKNFRPTDQNPQIIGTFRVNTAPGFDVPGRLDSVLRTRGVPAATLSQSSTLESARAELTATYNALADETASAGFLTLHKFASGQCQITAGEEFKVAAERRKAVDATLRRILPSGTFTHGSSNYPGTPFLSADLDREVSIVIPQISYYTDSYSLTDDLPDHITTETLEESPNALTTAFIALLDSDALDALLTTNDPDEQDRLRGVVQGRAADLSSRITTDAAKLVEITLSLTPQGLQITLRTDRKKSFYRHLSDATKFLVAYHTYAQRHQPGSILLFDEPTRGLHATAETYVRSFLERLAEANHVIVSTHSEHLLDVDHLDRIRLMQQDDNDRPVVLNSLRPPRDRQNFLLALQPVFDAIGLRYQDQVLTNGKVVLTEGLTDYLYIRAFQRLSGRTISYQLTPGRGQGTLFTLVPFMISQRIAIKVLLDSPELRAHLQEAYGISDDAVLVVSHREDATVGIEDVFSASDYQRILANAAYDVTIDELAHGNGVYAKRTNKRLVAQTFLKGVDQYRLSDFESDTQQRIAAILDFCDTPEWWSLE